MSKWLEKKIAARELQWQKKATPPTRPQRKQITQQMLPTPDEPDAKLLNSLLDRWEEREYGRKR